MEHVEIECKAENEIGEAYSTFITKVQCKKKKTVILKFSAEFSLADTGADEVSHEMFTLAETTSKQFYNKLNPTHI